MKLVTSTLSILISTLFLVGISAAQDFSAFEKKTYSDGGETLPYRLLSPDNPKGKKLPLIIFLHGSGERGTDNEVQLTHCASKFLDAAVQKKYPAYVVFPQCPKEQRWSEIDSESAGMSEDGATKYYLSEEPSKPMAMLAKLIAQLEQELPVDQQRIYVMGLSMGGQGVYDLITRNPFKFAAAVSICGGGDTRHASALTQTPLWIFQGEDDEVVPIDYSRVMVKAIEYAGGKPLYTEYPGVTHNSWDNAIEEPKLFSWLFSKRRK
ncbi:alpha/beta hydrolase-fold protein [Flammeovirgaceae bacterium SG7u.111]|nr:alpha/beta hydrolase-fold protein [Flammeovirgaceae bacterium SG7u.132]WPO37692.1 alpha/beta hydrolase-fold protein [Flammeovirgaceae bacterium SG7u.111]